MQNVKKSEAEICKSWQILGESQSRYSLADFEDDLLQEIGELLYDRYWLPASEADAVHRCRGVIPCFAESGGRATTFLRGKRTAWKPSDDHFVRT